MAVDSKAAEFFRKQMEDPGNNICCDTGADGAVWASISHGIYLSIGAAGVHRSLGVKVSFVQSTTMDSWRPVHLRMMELGGNQRFHDFLREQGIPEDMPTREKYSTCAAKWYRENLKALAGDSEPPVPLPPGTGHLPADDQPSSAQEVLDRVFASAPNSGSMTSGGVLKGHRSHHRKPTRVPAQKDSKSFWGALGATVEQMRVRKFKSDDTAERPTGEGNADPKRSRTVSAVPRATRRLVPNLNDLDRWLSSVALPAFGSSSSPSNAERLQKLSTGRMEGFGSDGCPLPNLLCRSPSRRAIKDRCGPEIHKNNFLPEAVTLAA